MRTLCWCPSKIGVPHIRGLIGCQSYKPRQLTVEDMQRMGQMPNKVTEYKLSWEMPDPFWAAETEHIKDFTPYWHAIPWRKPTVKIVTDLNEILDQWRQLKFWEETKQQPIRN